MRMMCLCLYNGLSLLQQKKRRPAGRRFFCCSKDKSTCRLTMCKDAYCLLKRLENFRVPLEMRTT
jgi:hypothetical protein